MKHLEQCANALFDERIAAHLAVCVGQADRTVCELYRSQTESIDAHTKFDMASITKLVATTMIALVALDTGKLKLSDKVSRFFPCPDAHKNTTIKHLLTHTIGLGHKNLCDDRFDYTHIESLILRMPLDASVGSQVLYSCPAFILLGRILETVYGKRLDVLLDTLIAQPLGMNDTSFLPQRGAFVNSNISDAERGLVNDYNCRFLGGVAGNAGVFSTMNDMKRFAKMLLQHGSPLVSKEQFNAACRNYTAGMRESRGLGFLLVDDNYTQTGHLFQRGSIGHCGHTGQSLFVDLETGLYVIILSDMTVTVIRNHGAEDYYSKVMQARELLHNAIYDDLAFGNCGSCP